MFVVQKICGFFIEILQQIEVVFLDIVLIDGILKNIDQMMMVRKIFIGCVIFWFEKELICYVVFQEVVCCFVQFFV